MKVVAINGSPRIDGNTAASLKTVCAVLEKNGIETEIINVGDKNICGCKACGSCGDCSCVFEGEFFEQTVKKMAEADGIILGSPTYYASIAGTMKAFLDKAFYTGSKHFRLKVGAGVVSLRRSGGIAVFNQLNNYFLISEMIVAPSYYWNIGHGGAKQEVLRDDEAMCVLENLGQNMAYLLKLKENANGTVEVPSATPRKKLNMIR